MTHLLLVLPQLVALELQTAEYCGEVSERSSGDARVGTDALEDGSVLLCDLGYGLSRAHRRPVG